MYSIYRRAIHNIFHAYFRATERFEIVLYLPISKNILFEPHFRLYNLYINLYLYSYILPGTQEVRGSIPGRGTTDFCTLIRFVYIISFIVLFSVS